MTRKLYNRVLRPERKRRSNVLPAKTGTGQKSYFESKWQDPFTKRYDAIFPMDKNLLFRILSVQSETRRTHRMRSFILNEIRRWADAGMPIAAMEDTIGNIYVMKGVDADVYPTIIAHTDTVHDIVPNSEYQVRSNGISMWAENPKTGGYTGVGGDDKVGIFIALSMLRDLPVCKAAFFVDEESGCVGSDKAQMDFFEDSSLVIQCDRRGAFDFVDSIMGTELYGEEFQQVVDPILDQFNYQACNGGMTDVWQLKELGLKVVAMNMSCGYFWPHTAMETIGIHDVQRTYDLVQTIMTSLGMIQWKHTPPPVKSYIRHHDFTKGGWSEDEWFYRAYTDAKQQQDRTPVLTGGYFDKSQSQSTPWHPGVELPITNTSKLLHTSESVAEWRSAQTYPPKYPACQNCGSDLGVYLDYIEGAYWCVSCNVPVDDDNASFAEWPDDDETQMPRIALPA